MRTGDSVFAEDGDDLIADGLGPELIAVVVGMHTVHLMVMAGKKSTITTTNLPFIRWDEIIKDKALCSALVDRLCHKAYLVNMSGPSYRVLETKKLNEK